MGIVEKDGQGGYYVIALAPGEEKQVRKNTEMVVQWLKAHPKEASRLANPKIKDLRGRLKITFFGKVNFSVNKVDWLKVENFLRGNRNEKVKPR